MSSHDFSLFDEFELKGYWWLPRDPDNRVYGSLSFSPDSGIELELLGNFGHTTRFEEITRGTGWSEPIIQGFTTNGKNVTLLDNSSTSARHHRPGMTVQNLASSYLFMGDVEF